jgi:hypothetical protein
MSRLPYYKEKPIHTLSMSMNGLNMAGVHGPPLAGLASLGLGPPLQQKDWDQLSMYSQKTERSVGRPRPYQPELRPGIGGTRGNSHST